MSPVFLSGGKSLNAYKLGGILSSWKEHYLNSYSLRAIYLLRAFYWSRRVIRCFLPTSLVEADGRC